jgi:hypothetical protein
VIQPPQLKPIGHIALEEAEANYWRYQDQARPVNVRPEGR